MGESGDEREGKKIAFSGSVPPFFVKDCTCRSFWNISFMEYRRTVCVTEKNWISMYQLKLIFYLRWYLFFFCFWVWLSGVSISTDSRRNVLATLLTEVGYFFFQKEEGTSLNNCVNKNYVVKSENVITCIMCFHKGPLVLRYALVM